MQKAIETYIKALQERYATEKAGEHSYRPAMQGLLEKMIPNSQAINEPKQTKFGALDFEVEINDVPVGHIEAKDIDKNLDDKIHREQLARYTESLGNLIFTNYREFRLFINGKCEVTVTIAEISGGRIKPAPDNFADFVDLIKSFAGYDGQTIKSANDLAKRMAYKARMLAKVIAGALAVDADESSTRYQRKK